MKQLEKVFYYGGMVFYGATYFVKTAVLKALEEKDYNSTPLSNTEEIKQIITDLFIENNKSEITKEEIKIIIGNSIRKIVEEQEEKQKEEDRINEIKLNENNKDIYVELMEKEKEVDLENKCVACKSGKLVVSQKICRKCGTTINYKRKDTRW